MRRKGIEEIRGNVKTSRPTLRETLGYGRLASAWRSGEDDDRGQRPLSTFDDH
jgi:hypothetical protein